MRWWLWLLCAATMNAQAIDGRSFVVTTDADARTAVERIDESAPTVTPTLRSLRAADPLAPGFHVLELAGWNPAFRYVVVIPSSEAPSIGRPLVVAHPPGNTSLAPDELSIRGAYGAFLEAGCAVLVPVPGHLMGLTLSAEQARARAPWSGARDSMPALIADLALRTPIDRERVILLPWWTDQPSALTQPVWPDVDATPFAAVWVLLPAGATPVPPPDPGRWKGRRVVLHASSLRRDERTLLAGRLKTSGIHVEILVDDGLDHASLCDPSSASIRDALSRIRRPAAPDTMEIHAGEPHPDDHEWISARAARTVVRVRQSVGRIDVTTPREPRRAPFAFDLWFPTDPGDITVTFNGRPLHGGPVPHGARALWRCLRREARSGRRTVRVLHVRR